MAIRTNSDLVKGVLQADYNHQDTPSLVPFIGWASSITDDLSSAASTKGVSISTERLKQIETWLGAHAYTVSDRRRTQQKLFDGTEGRYEMTSYLDMAKMLDPSGLLPSVLKRFKATLVWLGKAPSEATPYYNRD